MARIAKIIEEGPRAGVEQNRVDRVNSILDKAEKIVGVAQTKEKAGDSKLAKHLKKRAKDEARMAMRLMGILMIEFGRDVTDPAMRTRAILKTIQNGTSDSQKAE